MEVLQNYTAFPISFELDTTLWIRKDANHFQATKKQWVSKYFIDLQKKIYIYRERVVVIGDDNGGGGWAVNSGGLEVELMHFGWDKILEPQIKA